MSTAEFTMQEKTCVDRKWDPERKDSVIKGKMGELFRYHLSFDDGSAGEGWVKEHENAIKNFPLGERRIYRVYPLEKKSGLLTSKIAPANKDQIALFRSSSPTPAVAIQTTPPQPQAPPSPQPIASNVVDPAISAAALNATMELVKSGAVQPDQIEASVKRFVKMMTTVGLALVMLFSSCRKETMSPSECQSRYDQINAEYWQRYEVISDELAKGLISVNDYQQRQHMAAKDANTQGHALDECHGWRNIQDL